MDDIDFASDDMMDVIRPSSCPHCGCQLDGPDDDMDMNCPSCGYWEAA